MSETVSKFALAAGVLLALAFTFSCSSNDDDGGGNQPSSSSDIGNLSSSSCSESSSSHLLVAVSSNSDISDSGSSSSAILGSSSIVPSCSSSSNSDISDSGSSSSAIPGSSSIVPSCSSSLLPETVFCQLSDGTCPLTLISQELCDIFGGTPVQSCTGSSSSVQSSLAPSSSSSWPLVVVFCKLSDGTCSLTLISQELCDIFGGTPVQSCMESSSSVPSSSSLASSSSSFVHIGKGNNISNYRTVVIGIQTWMAENLDYAPSSGTFISCNTYDCATYGRLYDWSTAMDLPSSCNENSCSSQIQPKHQGICPSGWHIPSQAEWNTLSSYVESNSDCSSCDASKLKATSGWNDNGNGTDEYEFSALPGGYGYSDGSFLSVGYYGNWWSANEYGNYSHYAYGRGMGYDDDYAYWYGYNKSGLFSVRCVQD